MEMILKSDKNNGNFIKIHKALGKLYRNKFIEFSLENIC
jgi:hypothetical protein